MACRGAKYQQVYDEVSRVANADENNRKLFVHGLPWEVTMEAVKAAFEQFGEVESAHVVADRATGKSKGFGFVTFKLVDSALAALARGEVTVDVRTDAVTLYSHTHTHSLLTVLSRSHT